MASRKNAHSTSAEISLVHLKNCLVNLPTALVNLLVNINTHAQNVVVELNWRSSDGLHKSAYLGWTGLPSKRKLAPIVTRDGIQGSRGSGGSRDQELALVEVDPTLANTLGLSDGQKITAMIHLEFPLAHTVQIEPLTAEDWEVIELHANFLELNMMSQVRALPNPAFAPPGGVPGSAAHPLALHVSPTSTASIRVASLEPAAGSDVPFVKIAPNAEVIVAPKERSKPSRPGKSSSKGGRSVDGASGKSSNSTVRRVRKSKSEERKPALYLRAMDRRYCTDWFDDIDGAGQEPQEGLSVWVDRDLLFSRGFRGVKYVTVDLIRPSTIQPQPVDAVEAQQRQTNRVVAMLCSWDDPPNGSAVALSTPLCASLGCQGIVGGVVKIEPAPTPFTVNASAEKSDQLGTIRRIKVFPFLATGSSPSGGLRFGGESKAEKEEAVKRLKLVYGGKNRKGLLQGPLTDGQVLGIYPGIQQISGWGGGIIKFDPPAEAGQPNKESTSWILGSQKSVPFEIQPGVPPPVGVAHDDGLDETESDDSILVGIDSLLKELKSHLMHLSSVLLTGALGSGKTSVGKSIANALKRDSFYHTTYFNCRSLTNDESRVATVRETLNRLFMNASWGARLDGKSIVILDDLDKLCPAETELQVGNDNGRSRQISEALCAIVKQYCAEDSGVALLATAQAKESVHGVVIGGHVVREIVELKSPDKDTRRKIMEAITRQGPVVAHVDARESSSDHSRPTTADGSAAQDEGAWMDGPSQSNEKCINPCRDGYYLQPDLDFLDIAGRTDGYMPGDLLLLVTRARNAALSRSIEETAVDDHFSTLGVPLGMQDFDEALEGFTPASLHNVSLQSSTIKFDSIGGLSETRRVLLETLQYPTKYAPIFAQCPLRLRSGLLLYGYPGCGKTLLASAVAGECGLNFISVKGPEILNKYIGASEKSVRDLFERAQAAKPCVLFFDEFDSIAPKRGHDSTGVTDRVVNQLLTQMDGAEGLSGVYVLAATSRPDLIDPALLRPGRLDKSLLCDFPSVEDRLDIIRALASNVKVADEVLTNEDELLELARRTEGFTGADIQALMSNSQLEAIHDVLGDHGAGIGASAGKGKYSGRKSAVATSSKVRGANYVQFLYGEEQESQKPSGATTLSSEMAERAAIAAKLEAIKLAKKAAKASKARRGAQPVNGMEDEGGDDDKGKQSGGAAGEVVIGWRHIIKALDETRPSISSKERARLERIYREFVVGRSGQMKDGQPSMEIGGRSSLM